MTDRRYRDIAEAIEREIAGKGVEFDFAPTHKHIKVRLRRMDKVRLVVMSASPSDRRAFQNRVRDVRRAVRELLEA